MGNHIFISYSSLDRPVAKELAHQLMMSGFNVWIDQFGIFTADDWEKKIQEALEDAILAVVVWSANANGSEWVHKEIDRCAKRKIPFASLKMDATPLPAKSLARYQYTSDMTKLVTDLKLADVCQPAKRKYTTFPYDAQVTLSSTQRAIPLPDSPFVCVPIIESSRRGQAFVVGEPERMYGKPPVMQLFIQAQTSTPEHLPTAVYKKLFLESTKRTDALYGLWITGPVKGEVGKPYDIGAEFTIPPQYPDLWYDFVDTTERAVNLFRSVSRFEVFVSAPAVIAMDMVSRLRKFWRADLYHFQAGNYHHMLNIWPE